MLSPNDPTRSASDPEGHDAARVRLSLSEINALCFKAARGTGLGWGEAEEAGWAAAWLSRAGLQGPSVILAWLEDAATLARPVPEPRKWTPMGAALCPLRTGIAIADFTGLPEGPGGRTLTVAGVAHPLVTLPFLARAAEQLGAGLLCGWDSTEALLDSTGHLSALVIPTGNHGEAVELTITPTNAPMPQDTTRHPAGPVTSVALEDWQALDALALRITVPPSAQSRAGAGAAGDDND